MTSAGDGARARFVMDCIGSTAFKRFMNWAMSSFIRKGMTEQVQGLRVHCEACPPTITVL